MDHMYQLSSEARKLLVDSYVALRRGDTAPGSRVAYRMTVRQLEALIRLSEAIARSHLDAQVCYFCYLLTVLGCCFHDFSACIRKKLLFYRYNHVMLSWR